MASHEMVFLPNMITIHLSKIFGHLIFCAIINLFSHSFGLFVCSFYARKSCGSFAVNFIYFVFSYYPLWFRSYIRRRFHIISLEFFLILQISWIQSLSWIDHNLARVYHSKDSFHRQGIAYHHHVLHEHHIHMFQQQHPKWICQGKIDEKNVADWKVANNHY